MNYKISVVEELAKFVFSKAFSAGLGFSIGLSTALLTSNAFKLPEKPVKQVIICPKCGGKNSPSNRFCWHCGRALYLKQSTCCPKCSLSMPLSVKFCWRCGSPLSEKSK
ncbi:MAG: zinc ribbon domain-containing protein [Candidatus Bathyarchaeia archaeon]|nr:zinc ribbon domain-containing protein [Candidatus Bathyarchaeota archaeon]